MGRKQFSGEVIVQKTMGANTSVLNDVQITPTDQLLSFRANEINYLYNKGTVPIEVDFIQNGVEIGSKVMMPGYGFDGLYLQVTQIRAKTTSDGTSILDGMGVY